MKYNCLTALARLGFSDADAYALRRISMTLQRWHELECGDGSGHIERDEKTGTPFYYNDRARYLAPNDPRARHVIPDREAGAKRRLAQIMSKYPGFTAYIQGDPRGAALYILRPGDLADGASVESCYTRGICVY